MENNTFFALTLFTDFLGMAFSLWFAIYLLARSQTNHLTFRAVVALLALALYFNAAFTSIVHPETDTGQLRSLAVIVGLTAAHDLTHYLLPPELRVKLYWLARGIVLMSVVIIALLFSMPTDEICRPGYICPMDILSPWVLVSIFVFLVFSAILYNLWQIKQSGNRLQNITFYVGVLLGVSTVGYGFLVTVLNQDLPRFIATCLMLCALSLLGYSVARHQALVTRRTSLYDFPITLLTITAIGIIYALAAWRIGLPLTEILLLTMLARFPCSATCVEDWRSSLLQSAGL